MNYRTRIQQLIAETIQVLWPEAQAEVQIDYPPQMTFGDYSTSVALGLASQVQMPPREVAEKVASKIPREDFIKKVAIEGAGFINITLSDEALWNVQKQVIKKGGDYSQVKQQHPLHINVEFISANPTGPLTLANGRGGFFGDVLSAVFEKRGHIVEREYYVNDAGNQINILAESVLRKYFSLNGIPTTYPDYCYQGAYIEELARELKIPNYNLAKHSIEEIRDKIKDKIVVKMLKQIQRVIAEKMDIQFDEYFSEKTLYAEGGPVDQTFERLKENGFVYESDGAAWLKTSDYGDEKDRVLKKSDGSITYLLPDIAHHLLKLEKGGFDRKITILGADHHGYVDRMLAAMDMLGYKGRVELVIMQMIRLLRDGKEVRMSKRAGTYVPIEELIDEVGIDATRFFFLMHAASTHMDFNLELAKEKSEKNPVYYVQYAHARMCSILKVVKEKGKTFKKDIPLSPDARAVLLYLLRWPELLETVERDMGVHRIAQFATEFATAVHTWYTRERVINDDGEVQEPLLNMVTATQTALSDILSVMGISAPQRMD